METVPAGEPLTHGRSVGGVSAAITVTVLLTDVAGSTRLWEAHPAAMPAVMARHHEIVHSAVTACGGWRPVDQGEGDAVFAAFDTPTAAVAAAAAVQRELSAQTWPADIQIAIRIGVHSGEALLRDGNLFGSTVNRCARLRGLAAGGQTVLSAATFELVRDRLPAGVTTRDLGAHRLRDLTRPEHVYQLDVDGLPADFPPLAGLDRARHNLPVQTSSFIGRDREIAELVELVTDERLVTVIGFGGLGKTRLALQVAAEVATGDGDGVWFVDLSTETDPGRIAPAVNTVLGIAESGEGALDALCAGVATKRLLLVLDNIEQLLPDAADVVAAVMRAGAGVHVLATSREVLHLQGEREYALDPLPLPEAPDLRAPLSEAEVGRLSVFAAVLLFVTRATAVRRDFVLTPVNAAAVAAICVRLDGLPLALELAAARIRMLSPENLLQRLDRALDLLTGGGRGLPTRQQTLRATIAWSYDLLEPAHQQLLDRLSIFPGSFTLDAAEAICKPPVAADEEALDGLDGLAALVDRSLVRARPAEGVGAQDRYDLLVSVREYAGRRSADLGEILTLADRHARYYADLMTRPPEWSRADVERIDQAGRDELHQLRAALAYAQAHGPTELEVRLAAQLCSPLMDLGLENEIRALVQSALGRGGPPSRDRVVLMHFASALAMRVGDTAEVAAISRRTVAEARLTGDPSVLLHALGQAAQRASSRAEYDALIVEGEQLLRHLPTIGLAMPRWASVEYWTVGSTYSPWAHPENSELALKRLLTTASGDQRIMILDAIAAALQRQGRREEALAIFDDLERQRHESGQSPLARLIVLASAIDLRISMGDLIGARRDVLLAQRLLHGRDRPDLAFHIECHLAAIDRLEGDSTSAERRLRQLVVDASVGPQQRGWACRLLAAVRRESADPVEATALLHQAWIAAVDQGEEALEEMLLCLLERATQLAESDPAEAARSIGLVKNRWPEHGFDDATVTYDINAMTAETTARLGPKATDSIIETAEAEPLPDRPDWTSSTPAALAATWRQPKARAQPGS